MDSSNSGSFQSSSGAAAGDTEEYDSRTQSISSFLNPSNPFNHLLHPPPPSSHHNHRPPPTDTTTFFNPSLPWTGTITTPPQVLHDKTLADFSTYPNISSMDSTTKPVRGTDHHLHPIGVTLKNPKKRTRASRRAPTTVLTTDTTNFRQMVQEFTGIPTSPFTANTHFSRRLDLFRPTAQKLQQPPPFLNPAANIIESGTCNNITAATTSSSYQLQPSNMHEFQKQPSTLLDLQNPMLSFQSLLQSNDLNGLQLQGSSKSWRDQNEKLGGFEGGVNGRSKLDAAGLEHVVVSSRSVGDQGQGNNQDSWICPSS